jgi:dihydroxy-acid dehydratase
VVGHITPEAHNGGNLALVKNDDIIEIDAINRTMNLKISDAELAHRRSEWKQPALKATKGLLYKYAKTVSTAADGCVTDEMS